MAVTKRTRGSQYPLVAEFVFNYNDGMANLSALNGASVDLNPKANVTDFGSQAQPAGMLSGVSYVANTNLGSTFFELMALPLGAQVIGGELQVEVPFVGPTTATLALGDSVTGALYAAATDLKTAARTALTIPAEVTGSTATHAALGLDLRGTLAFTGGQAATQGRARVRVMYTLDGRINETAAT